MTREAEQKARAERHKQLTLAKIRELAKSVEVGSRLKVQVTGPSDQALIKEMKNLDAKICVQAVKSTSELPLIR